MNYTGEWEAGIHLARLFLTLAGILQGPHMSFPYLSEEDLTDMKHCFDFICNILVLSDAHSNDWRLQIKAPSRSVQVLGGYCIIAIEAPPQQEGVLQRSGMSMPCVFECEIIDLMEMREKRSTCKLT